MDLLGHLRVFVAVADVGSFTGAADDLGIPQPVASRRVAALERHLGGALFVRTSRSVGLTDLGRRLLPHAGDVVARSDHLLELAAARAQVTTVAVPPGLDPRALVAARAAVGDGLAVTFVEHPVAERAAMVHDGRVAAALVPVPTDQARLGDVLGAATATDGLRGRRVHLDQLRRSDPGARARLLHLDPEDDVPWVRDPLVRGATDGGVLPGQVVVTASATSALGSAIEHGDVVLCPRVWADRHDLRWRPLGGLDLRRSYAVLSGAAGAVALDAALPALARALGLSVTGPGGGA